MKKYLIVLLVLITSCAEVGDSRVQEIQKVIKDASYCSVSEDCINLGPVCPIGCNIIVNSEKAGEIQNLIDSYESTCMYKCAHVEKIECVESKCTIVRPE